MYLNKFRMKRIVLIFSALALFAACEKYEEEVMTDEGLNAVTLPAVISASLSGDDMDPKTRTYVGGEEGKDGGHRPHFVGEQVEEINARMLKFLSAIDKK